MKKLKRCLVALCLALLIPLGLVLSACGATPSNEVRGVFFDTEIDEATGLPVFYVDLNRETELTYKVNPSSWSGYKPVYQILKSGENELNRTRFDLTNGKVIVMSPDFEDITVQIILNDFTDTCIVRLKEYPTSIFFEDEQVTRSEYISANSSRAIHIFARFGEEEGSEIREITDEQYDFKVESLDSTIIDVPNSDRLFVSTIKPNPNETKVTVTLLNADGVNVFLKNNDFKLEITYTVLPLIDEAYLELDGYDKFIKSDGENEVDINVSDLTTGDGPNEYLMNFKMMLLGVASEGLNPVLIDDTKGYEIKVFSDNSKLFKQVDADKLQFTISANLSINLTFWVKIKDTSDSAFMLSVKINFKVN